MKVRYEFDLERDSCADCDLMVIDDDWGHYICCPANMPLEQRKYKEICESKRPDWCPLKAAEAQDEI